MGERFVGGDSVLLERGNIRQLSKHQQRRGGTGFLRQVLRKIGGAQAQVRPEQLLSSEPQRAPGRLSDNVSSLNKHLGYPKSTEVGRSEPRYKLGECRGRAVRDGLSQGFARMLVRRSAVRRLGGKTFKPLATLTGARSLLRSVSWLSIASGCVLFLLRA